LRLAILFDFNVIDKDSFSNVTESFFVLQFQTKYYVQLFLILNGATSIEEL